MPAAKSALWASCAVLGCTWAYTQAAAQTANATPSDAQSISPQAEVAEIVVTAQRREQSLRRVPIAISVVDNAKLQATGISTIADLSRLVAGLEVPFVAPTSTPYIRGVGANGSNPNDEPSVATYVDGVYMAAPFANVFAFGKVERVEVLKGPQGTLFGRNATGGLIQIVTPNPSHDFELEAHAGYGNYDTVSAGAYATAGLSETLAANASVEYEKQHHGYGRNITLNTDTQKFKEITLRGKLLFEPTDRTKVLLAADYASHTDSFPDFQLPPGVLGADGQVHNFGRYVTDGGGVPYIHLTQGGVSLRVDQDLRFAKLVSITARRLYTQQYNVDTDATPTNYASGLLGGDIKSWTQELQLLSNDSSTVSWILGGFYYDNEATYDPGRVAGLRRSAPLPFNDFFASQRTKSWSAYGQATYELVPAVKLTGGIRYTHERQALNASRVNNAGTTIFPDKDQSFNAVTLRASLSYDVDSETMLYTSFNRGTKSGGFILLNPTAAPYKPEHLDAFEAGVKSRLFDRRLQVNLDAFYYRYKDIQVTQLLAAGTTSTNAARAEVKGIELELEARPVRGVTLSSNSVYMRGKYLDFANPIAFPASPLSPPIVLASANGLDTIRTPRFTSSLTGSYEFMSAIGSFMVTGSMKYNGKYYFDPTNLATQPAYWVADGSIKWTDSSGKYGLRLWANNLLDERYLSQVLPSGLGQLQIEARPRTYGVTADVRF
jgi:iron complex outermembrane receptor protein